MSAVDRVFERVASYWLAPVPAARLGAMRVLVVGFAWLYLNIRLLHFADFAGLSGFRPVGVVTLLSAPLPSSATWAIALATSAAGLAFAVGWQTRISGPVFAAGLVWVTSYASSWGMIFHTENVLVLHVCVLALSPCGDAWSLDARRRPPAADDERHGWPLRVMAVITTASYLVAGITKLRLSGLDWLTSDILRQHVAFDALRKAALGGIHSPLGPWLAGQAWPWRPLAAFTLVVELGAPIALMGGRAAWAWAVAAWLFHLGVLATMAIAFPYALAFIAFAPLFPVERYAERARAWQRSRQSVG
jgi:HTTM domain